MTSLEDKLNQLRKKYPSVASLTAINEDEKRLRTLITQKSFAEHELVKAIVEDAKQRIAEINFLLCQDETLNEPENATKRFALFRSREVWQFILDRFGVTPEQIDAALGALEQEINAELAK